MPGMGNQRCGAGELSPVSPACMETGTLRGWEGDFTDNLGTAKHNNNVMPPAEGSGGSALKEQHLVQLRSSVWPKGGT